MYFSGFSFSISESFLLHYFMTISARLCYFAYVAFFMFLYIFVADPGMWGLKNILLTLLLASFIISGKNDVLLVVYSFCDDLCLYDYAFIGSATDLSACYIALIYATMCIFSAESLSIILLSFAIFVMTFFVSVKATVSVKVSSYLHYEINLAC